MSKPSKAKQKPNYVKLPSDFEDPKIDEGETFETVAEIRKDKDGYCIVSFDGVPTDAEKKANPDKGDDESGENGVDDESSESLGAGAKRVQQQQGGY